MISTVCKKVATVRQRDACLLLAATLLIAGCSQGPERVPVSGRVVIDGKPLTYGVVRFVPEKARSACGNLDAEGRFQLTCYANNDGTVIGPHKVEVVASEAIDDAKPMKWHAPEKYANFQTSGLVVEIAGPTENLVLELNSKR